MAGDGAKRLGVRQSSGALDLRGWGCVRCVGRRCAEPDLARPQPRPTRPGGQNRLGSRCTGPGKAAGDCRSPRREATSRTSASVPCSYSSRVAINRRRSRTRRGALNHRTPTLARPVAVRPAIRGPSRQKWASHWSVRGLNNGARSPVVGSTPARLDPLCRLHRLHARARFETSSSPPCFLGMTCSTWKAAKGACS